MGDNDNLKALIAEEFGYVKESLQNELKASMKTILLGGYSKKSVFSYIERMKDTMEQMHSNMEHQVNALIREKTSLVQETNLLRQQLQDSEALVKTNQEQLFTLQSQYHQMKEEAFEKAEKIKVENENYKKMEEQLRASMEEQEKLSEERRVLKLKIHNLESELNDKQKMYEGFDRGLNETGIMRPELMEQEKQRNEILTRQISDMKNKAEEEKAAYQHLQQKFNQLYQQSQELRLQLKRLEQERRAADTVLGKYQNQEKDYILLKQSNESYLEEITNLEASIKFMFEQMNQQSKSFEDLTGNYEDAKEKIQSLLKEKTEIQLKNVELIEQMNHLNKQLGQMENKVPPSAAVSNVDIADEKEEWIGLDEAYAFVDIGQIKKRSLELTNELKEKLNQQIGGL